MTKYIIFILAFCTLYLACQPSARSRRSYLQPGPAQDTTVIYLHNFVNDWLGTPYQYGGMSKNGTDCSGFTLQVMLNVYNIQIPRQSLDQYLNGQRVGRGRIEPGDLLFFREVRSRGIDHVGIYLGDGKFAHATENAGVTISELYEDYYDSRYAGACRY